MFNRLQSRMNRLVAAVGSRGTSEPGRDVNTNRSPCSSEPSPLHTTSARSRCALSTATVSASRASHAVLIGLRVLQQPANGHARSYGERAGHEIDVSPTKSGEFAATNTGGRRDEQERAELIIASTLQQRTQLLQRWRSSRLRTDWRRIRSGRWIPLDEIVTLSLIEHGSRDVVHSPNRGACLAVCLELHVQRVQVLGAHLPERDATQRGQELHRRGRHFGNQQTTGDPSPHATGQAARRRSVPWCPAAPAPLSPGARASAVRSLPPDESRADGLRGVPRLAGHRIDAVVDACLPDTRRPFSQRTHQPRASARLMDKIMDRFAAWPAVSPVSILLTCGR